MEEEKKLVQESSLRIMKQLRQIWGEEHSFREIDANDFKHLDLSFYRKKEQSLSLLGFSKLGDVEDTAQKKTIPDPRTFMRMMVSQDRTVSAAVYHEKPEFPWPLICWLLKLTPLKIIEFGTEFENGIMLSTSVMAPIRQADGPKEIIRQFGSRKSGVEGLYKTHLHKVETVIAEEKTRPVAHNSLDDICTAQNRKLMLIRKHLEDSGWISKEYLARQYGNNTAFVDEVHKEVERMAAKQLLGKELPPPEQQ